MLAIGVDDFRLRVVLPPTIAPEGGNVKDIAAAGALLTFTEMVLVVARPAELLATALSAWVPLDNVVVSIE